MNKLATVIVNRNCLSFTKNLLIDLSKQDNRDFDIILIDNNSDEDGTDEYLSHIESNTPHKVIRNSSNKSLNKIWNECVRNYEYEYISFLNNDIRIPKNFIDDNIKILDKETNVACVIHATNHPSYSKVKDVLDYVLLSPKTRVRQGWDFTIKTKHWLPIPESLQFYCGDDFIFEMILRRNLNVAVAISSPIIHYQGMTRKSAKSNVDKQIREIAMKDITEYKRLGFTHVWEQLSPYSKMHPTFKSFT